MFDTRHGNEVQIVRRQRGGEQVVIRAERDRVGGRIDGADVQRRGQRQPQSFALTDRVADDAAVLSHNASVACDEVARRIVPPGVLLDEVRIRAVLHEADVLAVVLVGI